MIKSFLRKHKQTLVNHIKLLSVIVGIILFVLSAGGFFGTIVANVLWKGVMIAAVFGVYMYIYEMTFGVHPTGNGFD